MSETIFIIIVAVLGGSAVVLGIVAFVFRKSLPDREVQLIQSTSVLFMLACGVILLPFLAYRFLMDIPKTVHTFSNAIQYDVDYLWRVSIYAIFAFSVLLFLFRKHLRAEYGYVEVIVGLAISSNYLPPDYTKLVATASQFSADLKYRVQLLSLLGGIYVVVRGLDNIDQGIKKWEEAFEAEREKGGTPPKVSFLRCVVLYYRRGVIYYWSKYKLGQ